ncbi:jg25389 [Pararge aegeria aegeria]|uniref:Jg25389 protein n=1 Tax=Pararge aegeria aegeria TaxID=348720 RepID=A0A8S4S7W5_9NEOP|nr:jg25389 [Pararge aegeria aegeria]
MATTVLIFNVHLHTSQYVNSPSMDADVPPTCAELEWQWAGQITQRKDGRKGPKVLEWQPRTGKRSVDPQRGGQTTLSASQVAAEPKRHKTVEFGTLLRRQSVEDDDDEFSLVWSGMVFGRTTLSIKLCRLVI